VWGGGSVGWGAFSANGKICLIKRELHSYYHQKFIVLMENPTNKKVGSDMLREIFDF
jgi:hypothetical protein